MRYWEPETCPGLPCRIEFGRDQDEFLQFLHVCPHHGTLGLALSRRELHAAIRQSEHARERARAAAKRHLKLDKKHPGVPFKVETDGSFTLGIDQNGRRMPEWPGDETPLDDHLALAGAIKQAADTVEPRPGMGVINNGRFGKALLIGSQSGTLGLASADFCSLIGYSNDSATEANCRVKTTEAMTITRLRTAVSAGNSGTATFRLRKTGSNANNVVAITGVAAGEDTTNSDSYADTDDISLAYTDTGSNSTVPWIAATVEFSSGHGTMHGAAAFPGNVHDVASATRFIGFCGNVPNDGQATEANVQWKTRGYDTFAAMQTRVTANARTNQSDFRNRINSVDGAALCSYAAAATGLVVDTAVGDSLASGDLINASLTLSTGVEDLTVSFVAATLKSANGNSEVFVMSQDGQARAASATAQFLCIGGFISGAALTDATARIKPGFTGQVTSLRMYLSANTYTGTGATQGTLKLYQNGSAVQTVDITASGGAGWYEATGLSINFDDDDVFSYEIDEGNAGSITMHSVGMTFEPQAAVSGLGPLLSDKRNTLIGGGLLAA